MPLSLPLDTRHTIYYISYRTTQNNKVNYAILGFKACTTWAHNGDYSLLYLLFKVVRTMQSTSEPRTGGSVDWASGCHAVMSLTPAGPSLRVLK